MSKKSFIKGTIILTASGLVVRAIGFFYRIYLSNLIGSEGMGLFQLIAPVYSLVILTLTAGISIAVSKLVAQEYARKRFGNLKRITGCALIMVVSAGIAVSVIMYLNMDTIIDVFLKDRRTYYSMLFLLPCIPVIAASSAIKGYFYGMQDMVPTALSQILEQFVKIMVVVTAAGFFAGKGLEYACAAAVAGMAFGEIANLLVLYIAYKLKYKRHGAAAGKKGLMRKRSIVKSILYISVPVSSNRFISSIMSAVEYILIPRMLLKAGMDYQSSIELYGKLAGMALPLIFFPSIVTSSLATNLVPAISEAISLKNYKTANYRISKAIQFTLILGFIFTALFMTFAHPISDVVYKNEDIGSILFILSFTCVFLYLQQTLLGILNGLDKQAVSLRNSLIGNAIRIAFVIFLIPSYGIKSYVVGVIFSLLLVSIIDLYVVIKTSGMLVDLRNWVFKPAIVAAFMVLTGKYVFNFFSIFISNYKLNVTISIMGHFIMGLLLMFVVGVLDIKQIKDMFGKK